MGVQELFTYTPINPHINPVSMSIPIVIAMCFSSVGAISLLYPYIILSIEAAEPQVHGISAAYVL